jgi:hypothetical protein
VDKRVDTVNRPNESNPFGILQLAPTLDRAAVKRAYFAQLAQHSPHQDPEGFRRIRAAYEALTAPGALEVAFLTSPIDVAAEIQNWNDRFGEKLKCAAQQRRQREATQNAASEFIESICRMSITAAIASWRSAPS